METLEPLYLTSKDIDILKKKKLELGRGSDGVIYKTGCFKTRYDLYKIYHHSIDTKSCNYKQIFDSDGVNIANNRDFLNHNTSYTKMSYYDKNGVKINGVNAVYQAIERQNNIKRTYLQKRPIYINGHFNGTVLHYHKFCISLSFLQLYPFKIQVWALKELLLSIKELVDNNIYHIDLGFRANDYQKNDNVLISIGKPMPHIIDIDGKSAIYTEMPNLKYYKKTLNSYKGILLGIFFRVNTDNMLDEDLFYLETKLKENQIPLEMLHILLNDYKLLDFYELNRFLDDIKEIQKKY